jgi:lipopolysaccharide transport system permease protein
MSYRRRLVLTWQLALREIEARYRGSILGMAWSLINPLLTLAVFTFVFGVVFQARWSPNQASTFDFAIMTFAGLMVFNIFAEVVGKSPGLVTSQPNLVKKVIFPLAILPLITLIAALFHAAIALSLLLILQGFFGSGLHLSALALPLVLAPLLLFTAGASWFLAALGVYLRDIGQIIGPLVTMLMFLSPIFYPIAALPGWIRPIAIANPLAVSIEQTRDALINGRLPEPGMWALAMATGLVSAGLGFLFFRKTRKGFADVL